MAKHFYISSKQHGAYISIIKCFLLWPKNKINHNFNQKQNLAHQYMFFFTQRKKLIFYMHQCSNKYQYVCMYVCRVSAGH